MIDPILSLAISMHSCKGVYALLLGSGVSRSAGIPTGWEVTQDLIKKLANVSGEDCGPSPDEWYREKYGEESEYSRLIQGIARTPSERSQLLKEYFEPTPDEREKNLKAPTAAHKAIAKLVAEGYIRVIITTNFDRLLENALEEEGVRATVLFIPEAIDGAMPLTHTTCTILKINGDYLDTRIRNSVRELSSYEDCQNKLLDRIFDEFGLIVCGWSAEYDIALRDAIMRSPNRRFTTFWAVKGGVTRAARELIDFRQAQVISVENADSFFNDIAEKVKSLDAIQRVHPYSVKTAVESLKRYLPEEKYLIPAHDLMRKATEDLLGKIAYKNFPDIKEVKSDDIVKRLKQYEAVAEVLMNLIATGCYWGANHHVPLWVKSIERIANSHQSERRYVEWIDLGYYPALLLLFAGGIAAIANERYDTFGAIMNRVKVERSGREVSAAVGLTTLEIDSIIQRLPAYERRFTPASEYISSVLREMFSEILPRDTEYYKCFDRFEYLSALINADLRDKAGGVIRRAPGSYLWRNRLDYPEKTIMVAIEQECEMYGADMPIIRAGLFDGSLGRFKDIKKAVDAGISRFQTY